MRISRSTRLGVFALVLLTAFTLLPLSCLALGWPWLPVVIVFVLLPVLDAWVGRATHRGGAGLDPRWARWLPRAQLPLQALLLFGALNAAPSLSLTELLALAVSVGIITGGTGITVAHELGHRRSALDRWIARLLLVSVGYGQFYVEHNRGHHARVGTAADPATAPRGMSVYRFILRSVFGGFAHAWRLEKLRLNARGHAAWHVGNWIIGGSALSGVLLLAAYVAAGAAGVVLAVVQAVVAVVLLEVINYIEHYGLRRELQRSTRRGEVPLAQGEDGDRQPSAPVSTAAIRYEAVRPEHSWNADFVVTNWLLFNLQLHSDHHAHVSHSFEALRSMPQAPQLPAGYPTMVVVALMPPLWFALMHPRLPRCA